MFNRFDLVYALIIIVLCSVSIWYLNAEHVPTEPKEAGYIALAKANCIVVLFMCTLVVLFTLAVRLGERSDARFSASLVDEVMTPIVRDGVARIQRDIERMPSVGDYMGTRQ